MKKGIRLFLPFILCFLSNLSYAQIDFMLVKGTIALNDSNETYNFQGRISNERTWMSITGTFGMEGMRALVEKDSTFIIDKLHQTTTIIDNRIGYPKINIPIELYLVTDFYMNRVSNKDSMWKSQNEDYTIYSKFEHETIVRYIINNKTNLLEKISLNRPQHFETACMFFSNYQSIDGIPVSMERKIEINQGNAKNALYFVFSKVQLNEVVNQPFDKSKFQ